MQIKAVMSYHYTLTRTAKTKNECDNTKCWQGYRKTMLPAFLVGMQNGKPFWKIVEQFLKLPIYLPYV